MDYHFKIRLFSFILLFADDKYMPVIFIKTHLVGESLGTHSEWFVRLFHCNRQTIFLPICSSISAKENYGLSITVRHFSHLISCIYINFKFLYLYAYKYSHNKKTVYKWQHCSLHVKQDLLHKVERFIQKKVNWF